MRVVPAINGLHWLRIGWLLFMRSPLMWILAFSALWLMMAVIAQIPILGLLIAAITTPAFSVGFMNMGAAAEAGKALEPRLLFEGFRSNPQSLITLGGIYLIAGALIILLARLTGSDAPIDPATVNTLPTLHWSELILPLAAYALVSMGFWFAPVLCAWHGMQPLKALFFSFFACLRNWRAFLVYGFALMMFVLIALTLASLLSAVLFGGDLPPEASMQNFALAFILGLTPMLLASVYASYRDIFG
ncbi:MAG TPA: BPSS1780 family membrane protein, partial [Burkholderiales bacterium]|nr:BPSS1780 family membrane protein [Burkholderiales bacterium]